MSFIFSRRFIQSAINEVRNGLTRDQTTDLVTRLNKLDDGRLPAMWEAVVLSAFVGLPDFAHEVPLDDGRKPDFRFLLPGSGIEVVGDVRCISDRGYHKKNPIDRLMTEVGRVAQKHGSDVSQFDVYVPGFSEGKHARRKTVLRLPKGQSLVEFSKWSLEPYIQERLRRNDFGTKKVFKTEDYHVEITFKERTGHSTFGHASYVEAHTTNSNPVWKALKDKADQLKAVPADAMRLIVLCDGGCSVMSKKGIDGSIVLSDIVQDFLRRNKGVDMVATMSVEAKRNVYGQYDLISVWKTFSRPEWIEGQSDRKQALVDVKAVLDQRLKSMPEPMLSPHNAYMNCAKSEFGNGGIKEIKMGIRSVTVSAKSFQRLFAGEISFDDFMQTYGGDSLRQKCAYELANGNLISDITISRSEERDDSEMQVTFAPDPAISPFK
ncbi:hypothetical protein [Celeribacter sp. PS-C1]|uniref:hypothetical protein n=1 Tax=Celeribacter sp. PS-C1 TaxID=2820813 RepID=UPI001CA4F128|nr:hypothetical protein [Celeribacter sp. PS-C1]MBW6417303.1 hypothetical protein [Celeribacter sp. PS-C1]